MKIICIGRNYKLHAEELGHQVPTEPLFFLKPDSSVLTRKHAFYLPDWTDDVQYEVELVIKISKLGKGIQKKFASRYYSMVGLGIDFTARDLQNECKINGHPWEKAKAFDHSAVIGSTFYSINRLNEIHFELKKNDDIYLSKYSGLILDVEGHGRTLKFAIACEKKPLSLSNFLKGDVRWVASIPTKKKGVSKVKVPFKTFKPARRANPVRLPIRFDSTCINRFQLLYSKFGTPGKMNSEFLAGPIKILIKSISAYS